MGDLTEHFSRSEIACRDGCGFDQIDLSLMEDLEKIRKDLGHPIEIVSGCRCAKRNAATAGAAKTSSHMTGHAIDVRCVTSEERYEFLKILFSLIMGHLVNITQVELCPTWLHLGNDPTKGQKIAYYG